MWEILSTLGTYKIGKRLWILSQDFVVRTPRGIFVVPRGYITDHASVPQLFWSIIPPVASSLAEGSIIHDYFYSKGTEDVPRKFADECLKEIAKVKGNEWFKANAAYRAVRVASGGLYKKSYDYDKIKTMAYNGFQDKTPEAILWAIERVYTELGTLAPAETEI